ncbi:DUF883 family protein [Halovulum sp. GXIMD14794]
MARATSSNSEPTLDDLQAQISALKNDIATLTETLKDYGKAQGEHLAAKGEAKLTEAQAQAMRAYADAETTVREHPATAVGVAAGLGFLVGLMTGRR